MMTLLVLTNFTNVVAEFAGIASSTELFHISRYVSVPLSALAVWFLVVKGNYRSVEKIFLFACVLYGSYIISGILVKPDWKEAAIYSVKPVLMLDRDYIYMLIGMVGTTIAPWMQFYLQSAVVEKGITVKEYAASRVEVVVGCIMTDVIAFFIIVACAGAITAWRRRHQDAGRPHWASSHSASMRFCCSAPACQRLDFLRLHPAAIHRLFGLRRLGFETGVDKRLRKRRSSTCSILC